MKKFNHFVDNNWLIFFAVYLTTVFIDSSTFYFRYPIIDKICLVIRLVMYALFSYRVFIKVPRYIELLKEKKSLLEYLFLLVVILLGVSLLINFITTKNHRMINLMVLLLSSIDIDIKKILKKELSVQITMTTIIIVACTIGLILNYTIVRNEVYRASIGFTYPTNLTQIILFITVLLFYVKREKTTYRDILFLEILNCFSYYITNTRTEFFLSQITIIIMFMFKAFDKYDVTEYKPIVKKIYSFLFITFYPIIPLYSFIMVLRYRMGGIYERINSFLSNRLSQTYFNVLVHGIKPFGIAIDFEGLGIRETWGFEQVKNTYVDNEYLQMMFKEGYIVAILFVAILSILVIMLYKMKKYDEVIICSVYFAFGIINPRIITLMYCPILFLIIPTVIEYNKVFNRRRT